jgi:hypothetical protein
VMRGRPNREAILPLVYHMNEAATRDAINKSGDLMGINQIKAPGKDNNDLPFLNSSMGEELAVESRVFA